MGNHYLVLLFGDYKTLMFHSVTSGMSENDAICNALASYTGQSNYNPQFPVRNFKVFRYEFPQE